MTLGQKLTFYRKKNALTQQQLGEQINVTAQAVSKWENDQAEPDLQTLRKLSTIYGVSLDTLVSEEGLSDADEALRQELDAESIATIIGDSVREQIKENAGPAAIGFCTSCGIVVTEENVGATAPKMLCHACKVEADRIKAENERLEQAAEARRQAEIAAEKRRELHQRNAISTKRRRRLITSAVFGGIGAAVSCGLGISSAISTSSATPVFTALILSLFIFPFISLLFFEGPVREVFFYCAGASIHWPGLIFEFSVDGFVWLIAMKLLFAVLGFLAGLFMFFLGLALGFIIAPFVYPFFLASYLRDIRTAAAVSDWE